MRPDFEGLLAALVGGEVEFVLVGGYSAMLHGSSLMTRDVDVVCPMDSRNLARLHAALLHWHPVHRMTPKAPPFTPEDAARNDWRNLYLRTDIGILDCLGEVRGLGDYAACLTRSKALDLGAFSIRTLSLEALIDAKRAMGRPRDLLTAQELETIRERRRASPGSADEPH